MSEFKNLFEPLKIGGTTIPNRFIVSPMSTARHMSGAAYNDIGITYFAERARGGFGLIVAGSIPCDVEIDAPIGPSIIANPMEFCKGAHELLDRVHAFGAKMFQQVTLGIGRFAPGSYGPYEAPIFFAPSMKTPVLTAEQIKRKIELMVQTASVIKTAGFDGMEIHAHWGGLLDMLESEKLNTRTDEYGGSLENRLRAHREIIEGIRAACGPDFPVSFRFGLKHFMKGYNQASLTGEEEMGRTFEESIVYAKQLEAFGYDALSVDLGCYDSFYYATPPMYMPRGKILAYTEQLKKEVSIPVLVGGGRLDIPSMCEEAIRDNKADAIILGRATLADPYFAKKVRMGKVDKIRPCIACNVACIGAEQSGLEASCAVNPAACKEAFYGLAPALVRKKVVVIGGGVSGMEAARTAKLRGHDVSLYEGSEKLGGHLNPGGHHSFKTEMNELNLWYQRELKDMGIPVHMGTMMDADAIKALNPDTVILSTGSVPVMPRISGIDHSKVLCCVDALKDGAEVGETVVVVGGGLTGCEVALDYAMEGKKVTVVEALDDILCAGSFVPLPNKFMMVDMLAHYNVKVLTGTRIEAVNDEGAVVKAADGTVQTLAADNVVIAIGFRPRPSLIGDLDGCGIEVLQTGDANRVADVKTAIWDAYEAARNV